MLLLVLQLVFSDVRTYVFIIYIFSIAVFGFILNK